jgi:AcrR family transcriptional regulator
MSADLDVKTRGKREETKASNRQAILDAARSVFADLGYGATTVRDIIRATELASGTFYNYFKSKEEVFQALQDETALRVRPRLRAERIRARNFEEFIAGTFRTFFDFVKNDHRSLATMRRNPELQRMRIDTPEVVAGFDELRTDLEVAIKNGVMPDTDADLLMAAMVGVAFEVANHMILRSDVGVEDAAQFATALFLGGVHALPKRKARK